MVGLIMGMWCADVVELLISTHGQEMVVKCRDGTQGMHTVAMPKTRSDASHQPHLLCLDLR